VRGGRPTKSKNSGQGKGQQKSEMLLKLELQSNPEALCLVRATIERAAEVLHFPDADARAIVRSVDEALANVLRHAYRGRAGLPIEVSCQKLQPEGAEDGHAGIEVILKDQGVALNLAKLKSRPLDDVRPGGLGLHFMKESMDKVEFSRKKGKNQLRMVKYLSPVPQHPGTQGE
jgi:serine/threonine-protein kinase RsbW